MLFKGLKASATQIITLVLAFIVICVGITILQMSKVDPTHLKKLDRRSTILLQAARSQTEAMDEKDLTGLEDPGIDALRGSFGTFGSMIRARSVRRMSQRSSRGPDYHSRPPGAAAPFHSGLPYAHEESLGGLKRHQLYDAPVPRNSDAASLRAASIHSQIVNKRPTIKFDSQDVVHSYNRPGTGDNQAIHEHRAALASPAPIGYPPLPPPKSPQPPEGKLLEIEGPETETPLTSAAVVGDDSQTSIIPPHLERSFTNEVHSAPPTMYARFRSPPSPTSRKDSRELFETSRSSGTLLSFPSVTDSARSEGWDEEELERQREEAREKDRGRSTRRYPKGDGDDDREESISLWRPSNDDDSPPLPDGGGIRLVQQPSRNNVGS